MECGKYLALRVSEALPQQKQTKPTRTQFLFKGNGRKIEDYGLSVNRLSENPSSPLSVFPSNSTMSLRRRSPPAHENDPLMEMAVVGSSKIELQMREEGPQPSIKLYHKDTWAWSGDTVAEYYAAFLPDGTRPQFTTKIKYVSRSIKQATEWKVVRVTAVHTWWGTSLKEEREPVQKEVKTTECVYYEVTTEMLAFHKSLVPVLATNDSTKDIGESPTGVLKWNPYSVSMEILNTLEKDQMVVVRPVVVKTSERWAISWKPYVQQKTT